MVHLRIVAPEACAVRALELLTAVPTAVNIVYLPDAARQPRGDVIMCDVAGEEASVILSDLRELGVTEHGSIAVQHVDTEISAHGRAAERAAHGSVSDAVIWEQVESRTSEEATLSPGFVIFMLLAALIATVGVYEDSPVLIVGAMVVCPDFGPMAGLCVGLVERRWSMTGRSAAALVVGFALAIAASAACAEGLHLAGLVPAVFDHGATGLARAISRPDWLAFFVAFCAGIAGILSLTTAKSGALIGVLISVTTIPAAAATGIFMVEGNGPRAGGAALQLGINIGGIVLAGTLTVYVQRMLYLRRRRAHHSGQARRAAGLPTQAATAGRPSPVRGAHAGPVPEPIDAGTPGRGA